MDKVFIRGLTLDAIIGIYDFERKTPQSLVLDIDMAFDNAPAAQSQDIALALDYKAVSDRMSELVLLGQYRLVETLAEDVAVCLRQEFQVKAARIRVSKPDAIANAQAVGVEIVRGEWPAYL